MSVTVGLDFVAPYAAEPASALLAAHAVPGVEVSDAENGTHTRLVTTPSGSVPVTVTLGADGVTANVGSDDTDAVRSAVRRVRRWLDLDTDPARVRAALGDDPVVGPLVAARPGLRVTGYADGFEGAVVTVLGQQVSLGAARTFAGRLVEAYGGTPTASGLVPFPGPETLAGADAAEMREVVGLTGSRARTVHALAAACADGLVIDPAGDHDEIRTRLLALPGIGPWTVEYLAARALGDADAYPAGDLVLQRALGVTSAKEAAAAAQAWSPYRAYAVFHLWTHARYA